MEMLCNMTCIEILHFCHLDFGYYFGYYAGLISALHLVSVELLKTNTREPGALICD